MDYLNLLFCEHYFQPGNGYKIAFFSTQTCGGKIKNNSNRSHLTQEPIIQTTKSHSNPDFISHCGLRGGKKRRSGIGGGCPSCLHSLDHGVWEGINATKDLLAPHFNHTCLRDQVAKNHLRLRAGFTLGGQAGLPATSGGSLA